LRQGANATNFNFDERFAMAGYILLFDQFEVVLV
jgi:hypothetical protein